eukprot:jgi/Tetstr1/437338/TSEL_026023.t1
MLPRVAGRLQRSLWPPLLADRSGSRVAPRLRCPPLNGRPLLCRCSQGLAGLMRDPLGLQRKRAASSAAAAAAVEAGTGAWLVVGLGNPGGAYDGTRHNVGFALVDSLAETAGIPLDAKPRKLKAVLGVGELSGARVVLAKPTTFMNLSGDAVQAVGAYYQIPMSRTIVLHDDLDLSLGKLRLRQKGSHGGHNGLRSIIQRNRGCAKFARLKIGIGRPAHPDMSISAYVLGRFDAAEKAEIDHALEEGAAVVQSVVKLGLDKAMSGQRI